MRIIFYFIIFTLFISCGCKKEPIEPTKIVDLNNKEISALIESQYVVSKIRGSEFNDKLTFLKDQDFRFANNGLIYSNGVEVGKWTNGRWIYLEATDLKLLINLVSRKEMKVSSNYFDCKTKSTVEESLYLTGNISDLPKIENDFDF